jgi:hypothetical protein
MRNKRTINRPTPAATMTKKFDLNIERVLEDWGVDNALREIIANALDERALTKTKDVEIAKDRQGRWHIRDYGRGLKYEHLTQNENQEKQAHADRVIGKFGVGLKDALATFDRQKIAVFIKSCYGDITTAQFPKHGFEDITTLHGVISDPSDSGMVGTDFSFTGVTDADIAAAKDFFLQFSGDKPIETTTYGTVLDKGKRTAARIFITGLRVAEEENFLCSYNITSVNSSIRKALNRERTNVGRTAYVGRVTDILLSSKTEAVAQRLVDDLQGYETGRSHDELSWIDVQVHACKLLNATGRVIFLTPQELINAPDLVDHALKDGHRVIMVPESVRHKIHEATDLLGNPIRDLGSYAKEWNESFAFQFVNEEDLTPDERAVFTQTDAIFKFVGGRPVNIKAVLISETMRVETFSYHEAVGIWEPDKERIIIKREQLRRLDSFASTLLHETAHATSGATDITEEFELELTELLGKLASKAIRDNNSGLSAHPLRPKRPRGATLAS